eukprot:364772-Chlamydomonas_euryale.AAC.1
MSRLNHVEAQPAVWRAIHPSAVAAHPQLVSLCTTRVAHRCPPATSFHTPHPLFSDKPAPAAGRLPQTPLTPPFLRQACTCRGPPTPNAPHTPFSATSLHLSRVAVLQERLPAVVCAVVTADELHLVRPHAVVDVLDAYLARAHVAAAQTQVRHASKRELAEVALRQRSTRVR